MKILLSAFACAPNTGSETGGGWMYAMELAKTHRVVVLTDASRKASIERFVDELPENLAVVYYRPSFLANLKLNSRTAHIIYQAWQMGAWRVAKELDAQFDFDVCWHLTYGVFRQPSWMWKVGKPFVFGPIGGGESAPMRLWIGMSGKELVRELARTIINKIVWFMPGLMATYRNAALVIARTEDTKAILPSWVQARTKVQQEIGGYAARVSPARRSTSRGELKLLFAGRLLGMKGVHLAIRAFAKFLASGGKGTFSIIGSGPMEKSLAHLAVRCGVAANTHFLGALPQDKLFECYPTFDALVFPSLHDSGGNVVIEALSFGLPVICLDLGGPKSFVDSSCGTVISTESRSVDDIVSDLANALQALYESPDKLAKQSSGALDRANDITWSKQVGRTITLIEKQIFCTQPPVQEVS